DQALGDPGGPGHVLHAGGLEALRSEDDGGGVEDGVAPLLPAQSLVGHPRSSASNRREEGHVPPALTHGDPSVTIYSIEVTGGSPELPDPPRGPRPSWRSRDRERDRCCHRRARRRRDCARL